MTDNAFEHREPWLHAVAAGLGLHALRRFTDLHDTFGASERDTASQ